MRRHEEEAGRSREGTDRPAGTPQGGVPQGPIPPGATPGHYIRRRSDRAIITSLVILAILGILTLFSYAASVFITILSSLLIALALEPFVQFFCKRTRFSRQLASIVVVFFSIAFLYGILYLAYGSAKRLFSDLPMLAEQVRKAPLVQDLTDKVNHVTETLSKAGRSISAEAPLKAGKDATVVLQGGTSWGQTIFRGLGSLTTLAFSLSFIPFLVYFILAGKEPLTRRTRNLFPPEFHEIASAIMYDVERMMQRFLLGNALVAGILSILTSLCFLLVGLPYWIVLGFVSGISSTIPYLGLFLALLPALVVGFVTFHTGGPIIFIVASVSILHLVAANYMLPKLVGQGVQLNAVVSTIAIMFFGWMWGGMGLILGIPIVAVVRCILDNVPATQRLGQWLGE
jgi:predicted PurR-regulated permease PerM